MQQLFTTLSLMTSEYFRHWMFHKGQKKNFPDLRNLYEVREIENTSSNKYLLCQVIVSVIRKIKQRVSASSKLPNKAEPTFISHS